MSKNSKRCWHPGCTEKGIKCVTLYEEDQKERYCANHANEYGYCYGCGIFCAGIDSFDFGRYQGLCDNCASEVKSSKAWEDNDQYDLWEIDPYAAEY